MTAGPVPDATGDPAHAFVADNVNVHVQRTWNNEAVILGTAAAEAAVSVEYDGTVVVADRGADGSFSARLSIANTATTVAFASCSRYLER